MKQEIFRAIGASSAGFLMVSAIAHYRSLPEKSGGDHPSMYHMAVNSVSHARVSDPTAESIRAAAANAPAQVRK